MLKTHNAREIMQFQSSTSKAENSYLGFVETRMGKQKKLSSACAVEASMDHGVPPSTPLLGLCYFVTLVANPLFSHSVTSSRFLLFK